LFGDGVPMSDVGEGETWTCTVTPNDGSDDEESASASYEPPCSVGDEVCPGISCLDILDAGEADGDGIYWIDPDSSGSPYEAYCLMDTSYDDGGWTLISVHSEDDQFNWTWNNRAYMTTDTTTFGDLTVRNEDYKSLALHNVEMDDLLFIHQPSTVWAAYNDVTSSESFGDFIGSFGEEVTYTGSDGFVQDAGTLSTTGNMCNTQMFVNPRDHDSGGQDGSFGPAWSVASDEGCPLDDNGFLSNLGPNSWHASDDDEWGVTLSNKFGIGFGWGIGYDGTPTGAATNYMHVYVR
jgi:hypothetical protein